MFFKRLFQCVRYSVSLYADCAVIYQGSRNIGIEGTTTPLPPYFKPYLKHGGSLRNLITPPFKASYGPVSAFWNHAK